MKEALFKFEVLGDLLIGFTTAGPVSTPVWDDFIKHLKKPQITKYIGGVVGAAQANSVQRTSAAEVFKARKISAVVLTESGLVRGLVTAASWLGADMKSYDWPDVRKGLDHLGVTGSQQDQAVAIIQRMKVAYSR